MTEIYGIRFDLINPHQAAKERWYKNTTIIPITYSSYRKLYQHICSAPISGCDPSPIFFPLFEQKAIQNEKWNPANQLRTGPKYFWTTTECSSYIYCFFFFFFWSLYFLLPNKVTGFVGLYCPLLGLKKYEMENKFTITLFFFCKVD
jgi:hypothetical protein